LADRVKAATGGNGIDVILDMSVGHIWLPILQMIAPDGPIGHLSTGGGNKLSIPLRRSPPGPTDGGRKRANPGKQPTCREDLAEGQKRASKCNSQCPVWLLQ
jgi:hypothetical protein